MRWSTKANGSDASRGAAKRLAGLEAFDLGDNFDEDFRFDLDHRCAGGPGWAIVLPASATLHSDRTRTRSQAVTELQGQPPRLRCYTHLCSSVRMKNRLFSGMRGDSVNFWQESVS